VPTILVGIEEAHSDRLDALRHEAANGLAHIVQHQRRQFPTAGVDATADTEPQLARYERLGERGAMIPRILADAAPDLETVAEACGCQHPDLRSLALQHGVCRDGRAVHEPAAVGEEIAHRQPEPCGRCVHRVQHAPTGIAGDRRHLEDLDRSIRLLDHKVGKRASDIDANTIHDITNCKRQIGTAFSLAKRISL
jgi:hypothetical protein